MSRCLFLVSTESHDRRDFGFVYEFKEKINLGLSTFCPESLVDQPECRTNRSYFVDIIHFRVKAKLINPAEILALYLEKGRSAAQIAKEYNVAKSTILKILHHQNVYLGSGAERASNPQNYGLPNPPFGYSVKSGRLILNHSELRVCRMIVEMMGRNGYSARETARFLVNKRIKNRFGRASWGHSTVKAIYKRWKDKI